MSAAVIAFPSHTPTRPDHLVRVAVPRLNKQDWISDYLKQIKTRDYDLNWAEVIETRDLSVADWNEFCNSLMTDRDWLLGKGGAASWAVTIPDASREGWISMSEADRELFRETSYLLVIAVRCAGTVLYIDPEGYNYARYVAFSADSLPEGRSREDIRREEEKVRVAERLAERRRILENPPEVPADHGLRFLWNGIQGASGKLERCHYSRGALVSFPDLGDAVMSIYAKDYQMFSKELRAILPVTNDSDYQTDYHGDDTIRLLPGHPLYAAAMQAFGKQEEHYRAVQAKREAKWNRK